MSHIIEAANYILSSSVLSFRRADNGKSIPKLMCEHNSVTHFTVQSNY